MKRKRQAAQGSRTGLYLLAAAAMTACLACFTDDGLAASSGKGRIYVSLQMYEIDHFISNGEYGSVEPGQSVEFLAGTVPIELVELNLSPPADPTESLKLPALGMPPTEGSAHQRVVARFLFGPGSEPFAIDSFVDISYRIANVGSSGLGTFETEILAMTLTGHHPTLGEVVLRESPLHESKGMQTISPLFGGEKSLRQSFIDVFFEISIGGGDFVPASDAFRVGYVVPEPGTVGMMLVAAAWVGVRRRKRR